MDTKNMKTIIETVKSMYKPQPIQEASMMKDDGKVVHNCAKHVQHESWGEGKCIAEEHAVMALPEATVGLLPCAGGTQNLAILVGEGWTKRMILCGERISAEKAQSIGLVEEVVGQGEGKDCAIALAAKVSKQSPVAVAACKQLIQKNRSITIEQALPQERQAFVELFDSLDQKEGVQAFLEKRKPLWKNK